MMLRGTLSHDWISALENITNDMNNTPLKRLGWLKPNDINDVFDSVKVNEAKQKFNIPILHEPSFSEQKKNQKLYEANKSQKFREGSFVMVDFEDETFHKAFDTSVRTQKMTKN